MHNIPSNEVYEINLWLSKSGEFVYGKELLINFSRNASNKEILELHEYFSENSDRFESEWRQEFLQIFPQVMNELPDIDETEFWGEQLHQLIENENIDGFKKFIHNIDIENWPPMGADENIYPIEEEDENGILPIDKAKKLDLPEIVQIIESILKKTKG